MGTKSAHPSPLSDIDKHAAAALLSKLAEEHGWTPTSIFKALGEACDKLSDHPQIELAEFAPDLKTIKKLIDTGEPINDWNMWAFFLWLEKGYGSQLRYQQIGEQLRRKDQEIKEVRRLLDHWGDVNPRDVNYLNGTYKLYRPSHVKPASKIICAKLEIGIEEDFFRCHLSSTFENSLNGITDDFYRGKIIPYGNKVMAIMIDDIPDYDHPDERHISKTRGGSLVIHFDDVDYTQSAKDDTILTGIALIAVGKGASSAWPIFAHRTNDKDFAPREFDKSEFSSLPGPIQDSLNRGAVHWNPREYPMPFNPQP